VARARFVGTIAGVGSTSGVRVVVGDWRDSPFGEFSDVMVDTSAGHRVLLAPTEQVAAYVAGTYVFDEVRIEPVTVGRTPSRWSVETPSLTLTFEVGRRTRLGRLLRTIPAKVATHPAWSSAADPVSRIALRGVRTRGAARAGGREWYGATDVRAVVGLDGSFDGAALGQLAPVDPPCRFGFSSTPRRPSVTDVVVTID
jgi:hypothetical protein